LKPLSKKTWLSELQADLLYGSDENCQQAKDYEVDVVSPTMGTEKQDSLTLSDFEFRSDGHVENCPAGHQPQLRKKKKARFSQGLDKTVCSHCPRLPDCPVKLGKGHYYLRYDEKTMRLARRRQQENTITFRDRYRWRAGVVNDHPNGATHDRLNRAIFKWPKSGSRTGLKLCFFTPFQTAFFRLIPAAVF
jgi:hypothetical protein